MILSHDNNINTKVQFYVQVTTYVQQSSLQDQACSYVHMYDFWHEVNKWTKPYYSIKMEWVNPQLATYTVHVQKVYT